MTLFKLNINLISVFTTLTILISSSFSTPAFADETDLDKMCDRQSVLIATEMRSKEEGLSVREVSLIRLGAINACKKTYARMINSPDLAKSTTSDNKVAAKTDVEKKQESSSNKKESIFDRLLSNEKKKDVSPMQKQHRTGGK